MGISNLFKSTVANPAWLGKAAYYGAKYKKVKNVTNRGKAIVNNGKRIVNSVKGFIGKSTKALKVIDKVDDAADAGKAVNSLSKLGKFAKIGKAATAILGIVDIAGDLLVDSSIDYGSNAVLGFIPGAGIAQLGAALINNVVFATSGKQLGLMNAKFAWQA